jgi:phenylacetate-CoA ligase
MQWDAIQRLKPTALVVVPSFLLKMLVYAKENKIDVSQTSVRKAICIGENIRTTEFDLNTLGKKIRDNWNIELYSTYASTEMQTAFTECVEGRGGHHHPELIIVEILNDNNQTVAEGEAGEVTITTLGVEGMPLLRYKTGDIARAYHEPCACGRTSMRLSPVIGRKQQMIKLKGTTLYPPAIFEILHQASIADYVVEVFTNDLGLDDLKIHLTLSNGSTESSIKNIFQSRLRIVPEFSFCTQKEIDAMQSATQNRKLQKFIDRRAQV